MYLTLNRYKYPRGMALSLSFCADIETNCTAYSNPGCRDKLIRIVLF